MLIKGNNHTDQRGTLSFVNDFDLKDIKRFYAITHPDTEVVRAWQGHKLETKHFFVARGSFLIGWVKPDNWQQPSVSAIVSKQLLDARQPSVLVIKPGHANGFKALEPGSILMVFSDLSLEESSNDTYRFEPDTWTL